MDIIDIITIVNSLIETIEILSDKELIEQIKESERNIKEGDRYITCWCS